MYIYVLKVFLQEHFCKIRDVFLQEHSDPKSFRTMVAVGQI